MTIDIAANGNLMNEDIKNAYALIEYISKTIVDGEANMPL